MAHDAMKTITKGDYKQFSFFDFLVCYLEIETNTIYSLEHRNKNQNSLLYWGLI